jgi:kynurenine formamidase
MARWVDLTQPLAPGMPKMSFMPDPQFEVLLDPGDRRPRVSRLSVCTHLGTHVDAPSHFVRDGKTIDQFPLERFLAPGVVWPVRVEPLQPITREHLRGLEVRRGDVVVFSTGWGDLFRDPRYYQHPYLDDEVARWLVEQGVAMVGVDFLTPDKPPALRDAAFDYPVHNTLLGNEVLIIENLTGLRPLEGRRIELFAAPILVQAGVEAAPARVFARVAD